MRNRSNLCKQMDFEKFDPFNPRSRYSIKALGSFKFFIPACYLLFIK